MKKLLSFILSVCIITGMVFTMPVLAVDEEYYYLSAMNTQGDYFNWYSYDYTDGSTVRGAEYSSDAQTDDEIKSSGAFYKQSSPYISIMVEAPYSGLYKLRPEYVVGGCNEPYTNYHMMVSVNDNRFYEGKALSSESGAGEWVRDDDILVQLDEGVNVIRLMPCGSDRPDNVYVDMGGLYIDSRCTAINRAPLQLYSAQAEYVNKYERVSDTKLGNVGVYLDDIRRLGVNFNNFDESNLYACPYFAYTVNVPRDGYYDIDLSFNTSNTANAGTGYFILRVDGQKYKKCFSDIASGYSIANLSTYLTKGNHTLVVTSAFAHTGYNNTYATWTDFTDIKIYGGAELSETQIDPQEIPDVIDTSDFTRLDAKTYADTNLYYSYSESGGYGGAYVNVASMQSFDSLSHYMDKASTAYLAYTVYAPKDGSYAIQPEYVFSGGASRNYYMTVRVNDGDTYKAYFASNLSSTKNTAAINVDLKKGRNIIYLIPMVAENGELFKTYWIDQQALNIDPRLTGIELSKDEGNAKDTPYRNLFTVYSETTIESISSNRNTALTIDTLTYDDISGMAYFAYTVDVPIDGYYDMTVYFGSEDNAGDVNTLPMFIDGELNVITYRKNPAGTNYSSCAADISRYLTKGTHMLVIGAQMPLTDGEYVDMGFGKIKLVGGVKSTAAQINPADESGYRRIEAETDGYVHKFSSVEKSNDYSAGYAVSNAYWEWGSAQAQSTLTTYFDKSNMLHVSFMVEAPTDGTYTIKPVYRLGNASGVTDPLTDYSLNILVNDTLYQNRFVARSNSASMNASAIDVKLVKGVNIITLVPFTLESANKRWINIDCLEIPSSLTAISYDDKLTVASYESMNINRFGNTSGTLGGDQCTYQKSVGLTCSNLTLSNLSDASYFSYTLEAPKNGYYDIVVNFKHGSAFATDPFYFACVVDGVTKPYGWRKSISSGGTMSENKANIRLYLDSGVHILTFTNQMPLSNASGIYNWTDFGNVELYGGLVLYEEQFSPKTTNPIVQGLNGYSGYTVNSNKLISEVLIGTDLAAFKGSIIKSETATFTYNGAILSNTDIVGGGTQITYRDGTTYTVDGVKGDLNGDGKTDIRDIKVLKEYIYGDNTTVSAAEIRGGELTNDSTLTSADVVVLKERLMDHNVDSIYKKRVLNSSSILEYCNPIGRLREHDNSLFMEFSACNFTLSGYFKGDITALIDHTVFDTADTGNQGLIFVEIDGDTANPTMIELGRNTSKTVTLASNLSEGYHTVKVSKGVHSRFDGLHIRHITMYGTPERSKTKQHKIEFLGDSITSGMGVYAGNVQVYSYHSYANMTADALDAEYYSVANSGWCFSKILNAGNAIPTIYDKNSHNYKLGDWDFTEYMPDVVVINLGTNDKFNTNATQAIYRSEIHLLLNTVRKNRPNAEIYWAYGMMDSTHEDWIQAAVEEFGATDSKVHFIHLPINTAGMYGHPDIPGQQAAAKVLTEEISARMGWGINQ